MLTGRYDLDHVTDALGRMRTWDEIKPVVTLR